MRGDASFGKPGRTDRSSSLFSRDDWATIAGALRLSQREIQIMQLLFDDRKEAAIAIALELSTHTVHTHLERLYRKLDVGSRTGALIKVFMTYLALHGLPRQTRGRPRSLRTGLSAGQPTAEQPT